MLQKAAMRLRHLRLTTTHLQIMVGFAGRSGRSHWSQEGRFNPTDDTLELTHHLEALWTRYPGSTATRVPIQVGVVFGGLAEVGTTTLPLFSAGRPHAQLMSTVDQLNLRFGKNTLYFGAAHKGRDHAPMRIAFTRIPDAARE
jgi:DNA polymerase-4